MRSQAVKLLEDALKLPEPERADLAACIYASLEAEPATPLDPSWELEIKRRLEEIDSGKAELIPWEEARKRIFGHALRTYTSWPRRSTRHKPHSNGMLPEVRKRRLALKGS